MFGSGQQLGIAGALGRHECNGPRRPTAADQLLGNRQCGNDVARGSAAGDDGKDSGRRRDVRCRHETASNATAVPWSRRAVTKPFAQRSAATRQHPM
jgi:hypothetical protein